MNLTTDKDGYEYEYDYENRIVRIRDVNDANVAEFTYDALGRRIEKKDLIDPNNTRRYYYNSIQLYNRGFVADKVLLMPKGNGCGYNNQHWL